MPTFGAAEMVGRALVGLGLVVGLVLLTRYLLQQLGPTGGATSMRLCEVLRLSPQHVLYVVEVDGKRLLLGSQLGLLRELEGSGRPLEPGSSVPDFRDRLREAAERLGRLGGRR